MRLVCAAAGLAAAVGLLLALQGPAIAQAEPPSIRPALKLVTLTRVYLEVCDAAAAEVDRDEAARILEQGFEKVERALVARTIRLGLPEAEAREKVAAFLERQRRPIDYPERFRSSCPTDMAAELQAIASPNFDTFIETYADAEPLYDRPFPLADTALQTHAGPSTQHELLLTITARFGGCAPVRITGAEMASRTQLPPSPNLPVFVKPTIRYIERWTAECGGDSRDFTVTHMRSSEGPQGLYAVE